MTLLEAVKLCIESGKRFKRPDHPKFIGLKGGKEDVKQLGKLDIKADDWIMEEE